MAGATHKALSDTALLWLYARGCSVYAKEVPTRNGIADALGIMTRHGQEKVYYVEAKAGRSDLICEKQKCVYARSVRHNKNYCPYHTIVVENKMYQRHYGKEQLQKEASECENCKALPPVYDLHIDQYYLIVADGVTVEPELYPMWGVINQKGEVVRRAKKIPRTDTFDHKHYLESIAHVLVYKAYGKFYLGEFKGD